MDITAWTHELAVLKHVSYILEAFASEASTEGKRELTALIEHVRADRLLATECRDELLRRLSAAQTAIDRDRDSRGAMIELSAAVTALWTRVHPRWLWD